MLFSKQLILLFLIAQIIILSEKSYAWSDIYFQPRSWLNSIPKINNSLSNDVVAHQVKFTQRYSAIKDLKNESVIELKDYEVTALLGPNIVIPDGTKPYLVRGVAANYTGDIFSLWYPKELILHVNYSSIGKHETALDFCPVIVFLQKKPKTVYVSSSSAL